MKRNLKLIVTLCIGVVLISLIIISTKTDTHEQETAVEMPHKADEEPNNLMVKVNDKAAVEINNENKHKTTNRVPKNIVAIEDDDILELKIPLFNDRYGILSIKPEPLNINTPVEIRNRVKANETYIFKSITHVCKPDGEIPTSLDNTVVYDQGINAYEIIEVDDTDGTFLVDAVLGEEGIVTKGQDLIHAIKTVKNKIRVKLSSQNEIIEVSMRGLLVPLPEHEPEMVWPNEKIGPGSSWKATAKANEKNTLTLEVTGYAKVLDYKCIVLKSKQIMHTSGTDAEDHQREFQKTTTTEGLRYIDLETGFPVREDEIICHEYSTRPINSSGPYLPGSTKGVLRKLTQLIKVENVSENKQ
jgi:hypothetical protein